MADLGWIEIVGWERFQHADAMRGETTPPWIKVYTRLLHTDEYLHLSAHQRGVLHGLWLSYASARCQLRADTRLLSYRLNVKVTTVQLKALEQAGFLRILASNVQAERKHDASTMQAQKRREEKRLEPSSQVGSVASYDARPDLDSAEEQEQGDEEWSAEPEQFNGFAQPSLRERPNVERDNGMSRLSPDEVLGERSVG